MAQIGSIGSSTELSIPPPLDHTKFTSTGVDSNNNEESKLDWLPSGYIPVEPLSPLKMSDLEPPQITITTDNAKAEIKEEKIKNSLKEIISDLDKELDGGGALKHDILKQVSRV